MNFRIKSSMLVVLAALLTSCNSKKHEPTPMVKEDKKEVIGSVYSATNRTSGNAVVTYKQYSDGSLEKVGEYPTTGIGTGNIEIFDWGYDITHPLKDGVDPLISAYGVYASADKKNIIAVNPGDGTVSSMKINDDYSLSLNNKVAAGAIHPLSIATHDDIVYVASSGPKGGNVTGFKMASDGKLSPIANSLRDLKSRPSCTMFTRDGDFLITSELATGIIKVFSVEFNGSLSAEPVSTMTSPNNGTDGRWLAIPVGIEVIEKGGQDYLFVSEARFLDGKGNLREEKDVVPQSPLYSWQTGSTSSYHIDDNGKLTLVSGDVLTGDATEGGQIANCWIEASNDGNTLWAANALSSSITAYDIGSNGSLTMSDETAYKKSAEDIFFSDLSVTGNSKYLNQLIGNKGEVMVFKVGKDGLIPVGSYAGLPSVGAYGLLTL